MRVDAAGPRTWLLATVTGWALLAWLLALAGLGGRVAALPDDPSLLQPLPQSRPSPPERLGPLAQYAEIGARPLFSEDRRPQSFSLQPEGGEEAPANTFDYVLSSVLLTPGLRMAIVQPSAGGDSIRIKLGETADAIPAWRLVTLNPRSAIFEGPEGQKTLDLRIWDGSGGETPTTLREADAGTNAAQSEPPQPTPVPPPAKPATQPAVPAAPAPTQDAATQATAESQMEAIRKRIEARRAQLRQEAQQPTTPAKKP
ncbi:MAG: hypothetical protein ABIO58_07220 [Luteimonas sp.]